MRGQDILGHDLGGEKEGSVGTAFLYIDIFLIKEIGTCMWTRSWMIRTHFPEELKIDRTFRNDLFI